ncbi:MAG: PAS domain-containing protein [Thermoanaerobaculia bacterium]|nr:PAS domain-containing protein [Thermoanaerobaculia bacterium]
MDRTELNALSSVLNEALLLVDPDGTIAEINRTAADLLGHPANDLRGSSLFSLLRDDPDDLKDHLRRAAGTSAAMPFSLRLASADGTDRTLRCDTTRVASPDTSVLLLMRLRTHAAGVKEFTELRTKIDELAAEIHQRRRAERIIESEKEALEAILSGRPLAETFDTLLRSLEEIAPSGMAASILLLDKSRRRLVHLSAPSLPDAYNEAIDGIEIGPEAGSCGTAVYLEEAVIVPDIETDPLWNNWKDLALEHDLRACW